MIRITPNITIDESEIDYDFVRASGPGGQHVNKAATAVQLRFDVANSPSLPEDVRKRLIDLAGQRVTQEGILIIESAQRRSQHRNREEALARFVDLVKWAAKKPKVRRKTRTPRWSKKRRLENKRRKSEKKRLRKPPKRW